jgi:hypothetical protein
LDQRIHQEQILTHLQPLVGLQLACTRRAADLRNLQFGPLRAVEGGTVGEYALHVQCPWRMEGPDGIITGRCDLWEPAEPSTAIDRDGWDYEADENLQDRRLSVLLGGYDPATRSFVNRTAHLVVEDVRADGYGGAAIRFSGGYQLVLFPAGTRGEDWRVFRPGTDEPHFVVVGGSIEQEE